MRDEQSTEGTVVFTKGERPFADLLAEIKSCGGSSGMGGAGRKRILFPSGDLTSPGS